MDFRTYLNFAFGLLALEPIELANELGVSRTTVNKWLRGESAPTLPMREPVYSALKVRLARVIAAARFKRKINAPKLDYHVEHVTPTDDLGTPAVSAFEQVKIRGNRLTLHGRA